MICKCKQKTYSNCQNIDNGLYLCGKCQEYKRPFSIYDRYNNRTPLTIKSIVEYIKEMFNVPKK